MHGSLFRHGVHALLSVAAVALGLAMASGVASAQDPAEPATPEPVPLLLRAPISPAGAPGTVTLELQGETVTLADREVASFDVTPGPIEIELTDLPPGADLSGIHCLPYLGREVPEVADVDAGTLVVTPDAGEAVTCSFNVVAARYPVEVLVSSEPSGLVGETSLDVEGAPYPMFVSEDVRRRIMLPVLPPGETSTITLAGLDEGLVVDAIDCDTTQAPGASVTIDPDSRTISTAGTDFELIDCTFHVTPEPVPLLLAGSVFEDTNRNGRRDPDEIGLPDWTVEVHAGEGPDAFKAISDPDGTYGIEVDAAYKSYLLCVLEEPGWEQTFPELGGACVSLGASRLANGHVLAPTAERVEGLDFGVAESSPEAAPDATVGPTPTTARAVVRLVLEPPDKTLLATFEGEPNASLGSDAGAQMDLAPGTYATTLTVSPPGYQVESIECDDPASQHPSSGDTNTRTGTFELEAGEVVTCTFRLTLIEKPDRAIVAPRAGPWKSVNARGAIACGGFSQDLPRTTDRGRLQVKQGGRRLIATSLGDSGRSKIVFSHDDAKPGTWRGTLKSTQQGVTVKMDYVMKMVTDQRLEGSMSAKFNASGQSCKLSRDFTLTYAGK